jgi:hypothetical protein
MVIVVVIAKRLALARLNASASARRRGRLRAAKVAPLTDEDAADGNFAAPRPLRCKKLFREPKKEPIVDGLTEG